MSAETAFPPFLSLAGGLIGLAAVLLMAELAGMITAPLIATKLIQSFGKPRVVDAV